MSTVVDERCAIGTVPLERGGALEEVKLAFEQHGREGSAPVLVLGGISAGRRLLPSGAGAGWWPGVAGHGCVLDPAVWRLLSIDYIGGRGESTRPQSGETWPALTTTDQAAAIVALLDALGIDELHAAVGASYGGMVALALASRFPERVRRVVALCAAHRAHPQATAVRSVQRRIIRLGLGAGAAAAAVHAARALAMTTYRTAAEFEERFEGVGTVESGVARFPVDAYLDHHGRTYERSFPPESFLVLSQSLDLHRIDPGAIRAACTLVSFDTDTLVPPADIRSLARALGARARLHCISTRYGHDGFLKESAAVSAVLGQALGEGIATPAPTTYAARCSDERGGRNAATAAARAGIGADGQHGAVIAPLHLSTTYTFRGYGEKRAYDYTRSGNPTRDVLAATLAELEHGEAAIVTATGMAAITAVVHLLERGDLLLAAHDGYGGTYRLLEALARRGCFDVEWVDLTRTDAAHELRARRRQPRMVWVETPSNPLLRITDIARITKAAHAAGALCVVDNTFLSPALQNPLQLGADIVVHSTTKYLNGHSDVVGGAVIARDTSIAEEIGWWANCLGITGSPFDSFLTLRGVRTLHARMRAHEDNARAVVERLCTHPAVRVVHHPALPTHRGHEIATRQQRGFGAMVSFELHGGEPAVRRFLEPLRHFSLAESLGGVESLVAHPASMTHAAMDPAARHTAGISDNLLRLSVGIESAADLVRDLTAALDSAAMG